METSDPIKGIKLRINESSQMLALSHFKKNKTMNVAKPVKKLVKNLFENNRKYHNLFFYYLNIFVVNN